MGDPKSSRKKWEGPGHPWIKSRLETEMKIIGKYGLRNKKELWTAETIIRTVRHQARNLLALPEPQRSEVGKSLLDRLYKLGLIGKDSSLDDILGLTSENVLERRLQTIVLKKGMAKTIYQARQFITHGHIAINGKRVTNPGYLVTREDEDKITYALGSPIKDMMESKSSEENQGEEGES
ncbi:MAG: 30S ribosomal protein S4 [Caldisphaera sp.]|uniref:30S ribosomal protein S4 n=1 Tax=Caldisphaera sp. TaxID=2060322 RepID=UPI000CB25E98|nr:30S ribosomal protein S4 [Caldisphaera sp.]PMP59688.1 MAG: 30S ribosomal protein S4 [Caldisphaera sp.]